MATADSIVVRPMRDEEARVFLEIHGASVRGLGSASYPPEVIDGWAAVVSDDAIAVFLENRGRGIRLVAERGGELVGIGTLWPQGAELSRCYVHPDAVRSGVGSALVAEMERIARQ